MGGEDSELDARARQSFHGGGQYADREVAFFDQYVSSQGDYDVLGDGAYARLVSQFEKLVRPLPGERCVDLGCGTGAFTRRLRHLGLRLEGVDLSPAAVAFANKRADDVQYRCGDITALPVPDGSYDVIMYSGVLHHFPTPAARAGVLSEGYRVLAKGGRLFAFDPNLHSPSMWLYRDPRSPLFSSQGKTENEVLLSRRDLEAEILRAGFSAVHVRGISGITFKYVEGAAARRLLRFYNLYEQLVRLSPFEARIGTFLVSVARKD